MKTVESLQKAPGITRENTFGKFQLKKTEKETRRAEHSNANKDGDLLETEKEVKEVYT